MDMIPAANNASEGSILYTAARNIILHSVSMVLAAKNFNFYPRYIWFCR